MRTLILLSIIAFAYGDFNLGHRKDELVLTNGNARIFEGVVKDAIECIRQVLANGDESAGLPPLDPFVLNDININLDKYGWEHFKGQWELQKLIAQGQLNWRVSKLAIKPTLLPVGFKLTLVMDWDSVNFEGDYNIDSSILDHSVNGKGAVSGSATNFKFELIVQGSLSKIKKIKITPSLKSIDFNIDQLIIDGNDVSGAINGKVNSVLQLIQASLEEIGDRIAEAILEILNKGIYASYISNFNVLGALGKCLPF